MPIYTSEVEAKLDLLDRAWLASTAEEREREDNS
jgi:hypothetical protein